MMNAIVTTGHEFRQSTDAAGLCGAIVKQTASNIQGRRYVSVEGWQAIAIAHGCAAGSRDVQKVEGGVRAIGEVRRMDDGQLIATAEGFVGEDEPTWYGGQSRNKTLPKRPDYAIRAMAQTRAISRACRSAFAHVVVMIDAGLQTTPAEEVPEGGFIEGHIQVGAVSPDEPANSTLRDQLEQSVAQDAGKPAKGWREPDSIYSTPTKLHAALITHHAELERIGIEGTFDDFEGYLSSPEYQEYIRVAGIHSPHYLDGPRPEFVPPEFVQTFALEQKSRDLIAIRGNVAADVEG
jgi:hypothetical protein